MTRRRLLGIVAAVLLALFGTVVLVAYVRSAEQRAVAGQQRVEAFVVRQRIPRGTAAGDIGDRVRLEPVPRNLRPEGAVSNIAELGDRVAAVDLLPGELVASGRFVEIEAQQGAGAVEEGRQVISISLDAQRAAGGRLRAGQIVGVIISMDQAEVPDPDNPDGTIEEDAISRMVLNQVSVTAVSGGAGADAEAAAGAQMVSLAVDESDAERLAFGAEHGRIWLTLQNEETVLGGGTERTRGNVYQGIQEGT